MKLGKLFVAELAAVIVVLIIIVVVVQVSPSLAASEQSTSIGTYNTKEYAADTINIVKGDSFSTAFDYSSYEPAILAIDLTFSSVQTPGYLSLICNGRYVGQVYASSGNTHTSLSAISVSGSEWIKPPSAYSPAFSNQIIFSSDIDQGFEGTFEYQINLKGSR